MVEVQPGCGELEVPSEFPTITAALAAGQDGDTVVVAPGVYFEHLNLVNKKVSIVGAPGEGAVIIDGGNQPGTLLVVSYSQGPETVIRGLTFRGSSGFRVGDAATFRSPGSVRRPAPEKRKAIFRAAPLGLQRVCSVMWAPDRPPSPSHAPDPCGGDATATAGSLSSFSVDRTATSAIAV